MLKAPRIEKHSRSTKHDEQTKLRALAHFSSSGSLTATHAATGVPISTIKDWTETEDGHELVANVRNSLKLAVAAELVEVSRRAIAEVSDRLQNGDEIYLADGSKVRRKVSGKDAMYIASNAINQHSLLTMDSKKSVGTNLQKLASELIEALNSANPLANAKLIEHDDSECVPTHPIESIDDSVRGAVDAEANDSKQSHMSKRSLTSGGKAGGVSEKRAKKGTAVGETFDGQK